MNLWERMMTANVGGIDRGVRIIAGLSLLTLLLILEGANRWWGLVGLVPLGTGLMGWCPAYLPFHISTFKGR